MVIGILRQAEDFNWKQELIFGALLGIIWEIDAFKIRGKVDRGELGAGMAQYLFMFHIKDEEE